MASQIKSKNAIRIVGGRPGEYPLKLEIIPKRLFVTIHHHQLLGKGSHIPCWIYVTEGLRAARHKEVILTVRIRAADQVANFPKQPLQLFLMIYKQVLQKKRFDIGDVLRFGEKGMLGFHGAGFTFPLISDTSLALPAPAIQTVLLKQQECFAALTVGLTRVLSRLGYEMNRFPLNAWNDLERPEAPVQSLVKQSVLRELKPKPLKFCSGFMLGGDTLVLVLPAAIQNMLLAVIKENQASGAFAIFTQLYQYHQGVLVWLPDKDIIEINMPPDADGELIAASFIYFQRTERSGATMLEDGFHMQFDEHAWASLVNAVTRKQNIHIQPAGDEMSFRLIWKHQGGPESLDRNALESALQQTDNVHYGKSGLMGKLKGIFRKG